MSVGRRLMLSLTVLVVCIAMLGAAAVGGLSALSGRYAAAEEQYAQLRSLYEIGFRAATVRHMLAERNGDVEGVRAQLTIAVNEAEALGDGSGMGSVRDSIRELLQEIDSRVAVESPDLNADVNRWLAEVSTLATKTQRRIVENRRDAMAGLRWTIGAMVIALVACVLVAVLVGVGQYRSVMGPLRVMREGVGRVAGTRFTERVPERGDREFRELVRGFNQMIASIERLHVSLRDEVEVKSRQLLRSEQLAGVGSLAAGLAHEINNPLGVIAGHAQATMRRMDRASSAEEHDAAWVRARETLAIVSEEAFRCRDIAMQLLRLAEPARGNPELVEIGAVVRKGVELVSRLPVVGGRTLRLVEAREETELLCRGHGAQLLQVVINLLTNAMEACPAEGGHVEVVVRSAGEVAEVVVRDNGCGMDDRTQARAFEPFFTDKPRRGLIGHGLGLSVSHAIVERHDGRLFARSDGPGRGSEFAIEIPLIGARVENAPATMGVVIA